MGKHKLTHRIRVRIFARNELGCSFEMSTGSKILMLGISYNDLNNKSNA